MGGPVAGFRIILEANGAQYEFHTNQDGTAVVQLAEAAYVSFAIRAPDNSIQIIDTQMPVEPRVTTGLLPLAGEAGGVVYALDFANQPQAVAADQTGTRPLDFIGNPSYGLAVWSGDQPRLGWATAPVRASAPSQLFSSSIDGTTLVTLLTDTATITAPFVLVAQRWSQDGQSLYFSTEPYGIGGYILFGGASSLQRINVSDRSVQEVIPYDLGGGQALCLDELSSDEQLVADHCAQTSITIRDLSSGETTTIQPPAAVTGFSLVGSARFSPDLTRVAFALAKRDPENEQGWVAVSDGLSGSSKLIVTSQPGEYFTIAAWLNADTLLLQSNQVTCNPGCASSLWTVGSDGAGLNKVAEGTFLTLVSR
jgi:hypothetical protein